MHLAVRKQNLQIIQLLEKKDPQIISKFESSSNSINIKSFAELNETKELKSEIIDQLLDKKTLIGKSSNYDVYKVMNTFTNKKYLCLKKLVYGFGGEEQYLDHDGNQFLKSIYKQFYQHYELLNNICHPNIIKVYGFYQGNLLHNSIILEEYCKHPLQSAIHYLNDVDLVAAIYEIGSTMKYLYEQNLENIQLSLNKIFIDLQKHIKIGNFINVINFSSLQLMFFMAPEIIEEETIMTNEKITVFAFGIIIYFIVTKGSRPKRNLKSNTMFKLPSTINDTCQKLITNCCSYEPEQRPTFREIIRFIEENNFLLIDGIESEIPDLKKHLGLDNN